MRRSSLALALAFAAACGSNSTPAASAPLATASAPASTASGAGAARPTTGAARPTTGATAPYLRIALTNVGTGERFTLGGFTGKTVIVEGMAVW